MAAIFDILGATFVGGILVLILLTAMDENMQSFVNHNADAIVQNELATMTEIVQSDLRKTGFNVPEYEDVFIIADSARVRYLADIDMNGVVDTVEYNVLPLDTLDFIDTSLALFSVNRRIGSLSGARSWQVGTILNSNVFRYLDQSGNDVTYIQATKMVEVTMVALTPDVYLDQDYYNAMNPEERQRALNNLIELSFWRQTRVISKNLKR